jgi:hypothetical protein
MQDRVNLELPERPAPSVCIIDQARVCVCPFNDFVGNKIPLRVTRFFNAKLSAPGITRIYMLSL